MERQLAGDSVSTPSHSVANHRENESSMKSKKPAYFMSTKAAIRMGKKRGTKRLPSTSLLEPDNKRVNSLPPPAKKEKSIDLLVFPPTIISHRKNISLDISLASVTGHNQALPDVTDSPKLGQQQVTLGKYPTLLTSPHLQLMAKPQDHPPIENLDSVEGQSQQPPPQNPFIPLTKIKTSEDYLSLKRKLIDTTKVLTVNRQLRYNKKISDKYRSVIKKSNDDLLQSIVSIAKYDSRHTNFDYHIKIKPKPKLVEDISDPGEEDAKLESVNIPRNLSLAWYPRRDMNGGPLEFREGRRLCAVGSKAYILGGYSTGGVKFDNLLCYDASSNALMVSPTGKTNPGQRAYHSMVHLNHSIYIFGGELIRRGVEPLLYSDVWRFDLRTLKFRLIRTPTSIEPRKNHATCCFGNNYMLIYGGSNDAGQTLADLQLLAVSRLA